MIRAMAQRISRAKQTISGTGFDFSLPTGAERTERLRAVLHVLYLVFNEGYTATAGDALTVPTLLQEAIRLTRWLHRLLPDDGEVAGLLALMLLTDARRAARTRPDGSLVPLAQQDRQKWDQVQIAEGTHARTGRRHRRGGGRLPRRGPACDQPARTPLPGPAGRAADPVTGPVRRRPAVGLLAPSAQQEATVVG